MNRVRAKGEKATDMRKTLEDFDAQSLAVIRRFACPRRAPAGADVVRGIRRAATPILLPAKAPENPPEIMEMDY
jgi:hypothetical protein